MPSPAPALVTLRHQVNSRWPQRSKASDGIMGDARHQRTDSDHNRGDAIDLTHDPANGFDAGSLADAFRRQMSSARAGRITYIIFNRRIASAKSGWAWRQYAGDNPHTNHVHISIHHARRGEVRPWKLE